jgi:hypothetical protein
MDIDVRDLTEQAVRCRAVGIDRDADRLDLCSCVTPALCLALVLPAGAARLGGSAV